MLPDVSCNLRFLLQKDFIMWSFIVYEQQVLILFVLLLALIHHICVEMSADLYAWNGIWESDSWNCCTTLKHDEWWFKHNWLIGSCMEANSCLLIIPVEIDLLTSRHTVRCIINGNLQKVGNALVIHHK